MAPAKAPARATSARVPDDAQGILDWLKRRGSQAGRDGMARYAIPTDKAFGVAVRDVQALAKQLGRSHDLAAGLWKTGWYEARVLAAYVDEPSRVTRVQMDRWCRDFDNWASATRCASSCSTARHTRGRGYGPGRAVTTST